MRVNVIGEIGIAKAMAAAIAQRETMFDYVAEISNLRETKRRPGGVGAQRGTIGRIVRHSARSKVYEPNGKREIERRTQQVAAGSLKLSNGYRPDFCDNSEVTAIWRKLHCVSRCLDFLMWLDGEGVAKVLGIVAFKPYAVTLSEEWGNKL